MYGKMVNVDGIDVFVLYFPWESEEVIMERAKRILNNDIE